MLGNANLTLRGAVCALVPYRAAHVLQYHAWMEDPAIQEATASEPLSLEVSARGHWAGGRMRGGAGVEGWARGHGDGGWRTKGERRRRRRLLPAERGG
jgi:hypothetical protein